jgi:peptide/nickel transport system ATP-binding protein
VKSPPQGGVFVSAEQAVRESFSHLRKLANQGKAVLLISHDIVACLAVADRAAVFLDGEIVEVAPAASFSKDGAALHHPYSRTLWNALPQNGFVPPGSRHWLPQTTAPARRAMSDGSGSESR